MKQKTFHLYLMAVAFIAIATSSIIFAYAAQQSYKAFKYEEAYLVEQARADAAEKVINLVAADYDDFFEIYADTEQYCDWCLAQESSERFFSE